MRILFFHTRLELTILGHASSISLPLKTFGVCGPVRVAALPAECSAPKDETFGIERLASDLRGDDSHIKGSIGLTGSLERDRGLFRVASFVYSAPKAGTLDIGSLASV